MEKTAIENELALFNLPESMQIELKANFTDYFTQLKVWEKEVLEIEVTDKSQNDKIEKAKIACKNLASTRIEIEKRRKKLKADSLNIGKAIDQVAKKLQGVIEPLETHAKNQAQFVELQEAKRRTELIEVRSQLLAPYCEDLTIYRLADLTDEAFQDVLTNSKLAYEAKIAIEKQAEIERIKQEKLQKEKEALQQIEIEKLKQQAREREMLFKIEQDKLKKEQLERAEIEAEKRKLEAEKIRLEKEKELESAKKLEAEQRRLAAGDVEKLKELAQILIHMDLPECSDKKYQVLVYEIASDLMLIKEKIMKAII